MKVKTLAIALVTIFVASFAFAWADASEQVKAKNILAKVDSSAVFVKAPWIESQSTGIVYYIRYTKKSEQCAMVIRDHGNGKLESISPTC